MARQPTVVWLDAAQIAALDERAAREGRSRSELIDQAIDGLLGRGDSAAVDQAIVAGYARAPAAEPDAALVAAAIASIRAEPW